MARVLLYNISNRNAADALILWTIERIQQVTTNQQQQQQQQQQQKLKATFFRYIPYI